MPDLSSQSTIFRRGGFSFTGYLGTPAETVVLAGTISAVPTYPATALAYTLTSGDEDDVRQDMKVVFFSSVGTRKAELRIASGATTTSTSLKIEEFSRGTYDVAVNDTFQVYSVWNIRTRLVSATAALNKDSRIAVGTNTSHPPAVCNSGGFYAGFDTSVTFDGSTSFRVNPNSGSITHSWDFIDGTPSTSTSAAPTSIFPVGERWVVHTITDTESSKTTTQYVWVRVYDSDDPPLAVQMDSLSGDVDNGWRCTFKVPRGSEGSITSLPDGALITYLEKERYNGTEASYGSNVTGRSHLKFVGYLISDSIHISPDGDEVSFEAVSPLTILSQTPSLPQLMVSTASPTKWSQLTSLNTQRMLVYLSYWHASLQDVFDFVWNDGLDISYTRIAVEGQSIAEQLRDIAQGLNLQVTCDRLGRILFTRDPDFLTSGERSSRTTTYDLTTADVMEIDVSRNHRGTTKFVRGEGITSANKPVFSNSPGNAPAPYAPGSDTLSKQIVTSQTDLNTRTGYYFAKVNGLYNGQFVPQGARIKLPDGYDVFEPALREFVTLTLAGSLNGRGVGWDDTTKWTVEAVNISYDLEAGAKTIDVTINHETSGVAGITHIPPQETDNGLPPLSDFPPLDVTFPDIGTDTGIGIGSGGGVVAASGKGFAAFSTDNTLNITHDFNTPEASDGPDWDTTIDLTALTNWGGGTLISFCADPYSPAYVGTASTAVNGWIVTTTHVQKILDIFGTVALNTAHALHDTSSNRTMVFSRKTKNFGIVATWYSTEGVFAAYTTDGSTWTEAVVSADYLTTGGVLAPGLHLSNVTAGKARISVWTVTDDPMAPSDAEASVYQTLDSGGSWALLASPTIDSGDNISSSLLIPFKNKSETIFYHRKHSTADGVQVIRHLAGTDTDITPTDSGIKLTPSGQYLHELAMPDQDLNTLVVVGFAGAGGFGWDIGTRFGDGASPIGTIDERGINYIIATSALDGADSHAIFLQTIGDVNTCGIIDHVETLSGAFTAFSWVDCGDVRTGANFEFGLVNNACINMFGLAILSGSGAFQVKIYFAPVTDACSTTGGLTSGIAITENAQATAPEWTAIENEAGAFYTEIFALSSKSFLLMGLGGAIGLSDKVRCDSRKGNLSTTGRVCGVAGN